ncbi:MAG: D-alanyl-D-alanine carboxypeptidase, partial [Pseudomonadota bacterium]
VVLPKPELSRAAPKGTVLVEHRSAPLQTILRDMLKFSTNLTAEVVGLTASGSTSKSLEASARKMTAWARRNLGLSKAKFVDHSGLGGASRLNAAEMVNALVRARRTFDFASILKDIPMRDSNGNVLANHPVKVRAKTGTLNFASSLAGYMTTEDGRTMVFAIFSADVPRRESLRPADGDIPDGSVGWRKRARRLQLQLLDRWGNAYAA